MMKLLTLLALCLVTVHCTSLSKWSSLIGQTAEETTGDIWAVLVAGSSGYDNYRHQADVCHSYQILHAHGVPDDRIIVMMYDDIAYNVENPTQGIILNKPNGNNVYSGVLKDYTGADVTPENFMKILTGQATGAGNGKVLQSGPNDHVFVYFADHGGVGILAFPFEYLYVDQLTQTITQMHETEMYGKLVFYVEACESGSMFDGVLPNDINVYTTTASKPHQRSSACYWDDERQAYLGDVYSVNWMEDSDAEDLTTESLETQWTVVEEETTTSHVMQYGDLSMSSMDVSEFQGRKESVSTFSVEKGNKDDAVPSPEVPVHIIKKKIEKAKSIEEKEMLEAQLESIYKGRAFLASVVNSIVSSITEDESATEKMLSSHSALKDHPCHEASTRAFSNKCFNLPLNDYALRYVQVFVNLCEEGFSAQKIVQAIDEVCVHSPVVGIV